MTTSIPAGGLRRCLFQGVLALSIRHVASQLIALAKLLLIIALLTPADYGLYIIAYGIVGYATSVSNLGIGTYLVRCREPPSWQRIGTANTLSLLIGTIGMLFFVAIARPLAEWLQQPDLTLLLMALALLIPLQLMQKVSAGLLDRDLAYRHSATIDLGCELAGFLLALVVVTANRSPWGLVFGILLHHSLRFFFTSRAVGWRLQLAWDPDDAARLVRFGVGVGLSEWLWNLRNLVNPLLVAKLLSPEATGIIALCIRVVEISGFLRHTIWRVYMGGLSHLRSRGAALAMALEETLASQLLAVGTMLAVVTALAPELTELLPESRWNQLQTLYPFLAAGVLANAGFNLYSGTLIVLGITRPVVIFHGITSLLFIGTAILLLHRWPDLRSYGLTTLLTACAYPLIWLPLRHRLADLRVLPNALLLCIFLCILALAVALWKEALWLRLSTIVVVCAAIVLLPPRHRKLLFWAGRNAGTQ